MNLILKHVKDTKNFACFETYNSDFRFPFTAVLKMWLPFGEFEGGLIPQEITVKICDDSDSETLNQAAETPEALGPLGWSDEELGSDPNG